MVWETHEVHEWYIHILHLADKESCLLPVTRLDQTREKLTTSDHLDTDLSPFNIDLDPNIHDHKIAQHWGRPHVDFYLHCPHQPKFYANTMSLITQAAPQAYDRSSERSPGEWLNEQGGCWNTNIGHLFTWMCGQCSNIVGVIEMKGAPWDMETR